MRLLDFKGIWKGEYIPEDRFQQSIVKTPVPFILKLRLVDENGLFEGMCQDDPTISKIDFPADVFGSIRDSTIIFCKRYPHVILDDSFGNIVKANEPMDVLYEAKIPDSGKIFGTWAMSKTFRKINGKVMELGPMNGVWWMTRF